MAQWRREHRPGQQPNHVETVVARMPVEGEEHLVKLSRYHAV